MKRIRLLFLLLLLTGSLVIAQTVQISGTVTSSEDDLPIPGVSVSVKGTTLGAITGIDGKYALSVPSTAQTIVFSFIGFMPQELPIEGKTKIDIVLELDVFKVDEVVVVAYGTARKGSYTGAATQISTEQIASRPIANISNAIEGSAPGIQVTSSTGQPGSGQTIRIRGFGSYSASNDPLYVVDGVPYTGTLANLNSNDIENITILKDAASTALYGSKAANGVVMVTTKKGTKERSVIAVNVSQGISTRSIPEYERINPYQYYPVMWEAYRNSLVYAATPIAGMTMDIANQLASGQLPRQLTGSNAGKQIFGTNYYFDVTQNLGINGLTQEGFNIFNVPNDQVVGLDGQLNSSAQIIGTYAEDLDWQDAIMRKGQRGEYGLTYSGGTEKSDYYVSIGYMNEKGYTVKSDYERYTGRININTQPRKWVKTGFNLSGTMTKSNVAVSGGSSYVNPFLTTRNMGPIYPVHAHDPATGEYWPDAITGGKTYDLGLIPGVPLRPANAGRHVVAETYWNDDLYKRNVLSARTYVDIFFLNDFKFTLNLSSDMSAYNGSGFENKIVGDGAPAGRGEKVNSLTANVTVNQLLNYSKTFGKHSVEALVGHENHEYTYNYLRGFKQGLIVDGVTELINFTTINSCTSYTDSYSSEGFFGRANYTYDDKYLLSASFRRDGSSRFYSENRWGNFWSLSAGWRLDEEDFIKSISMINLLKFRTSYGATGNDEVGYYAWQALYDLGRNNANEPGLIQSSLANTQLSWESNNQFDIALDFGIFRRFSGSIEYYRRTSSNLLFDVPLPSSSGITSQSQNVGTMYNEGFEFQFVTDIVKKRDFNWTIDLNFSTLKNKLTKLPEGQEEIINGTKKLMVGHSLYDFWLREWYGVDPTDGAALYRADDSDMATQSSNLRVMGADTASTSQNNARYHYAGTAIPDLIGGITNTFSYKGVVLSILTTFQIGGQFYDGNYAGLMSAGTYGSAMHPDILTRWQNPGDVTNVPRLDAGQVSIFGATSDRFLVDASYLAIKSVSLGYNFPSSLVRKMNIANARIYLSGENLRLFNARQGLDSQQSFAGNTDNRYTPSRILSVGLNITL